MAAPRELWMPGGVRMELQQTGADTAGAFFLFVDHPPAGWALPVHRHLRESETILVLDGVFWMEVDGVRSELRAGESVHVPAGTPHAGGNAGTSTGRRVVLFSPAGIEGFFLEVGTAEPDATVDAAAALDSAQRHGWRF